MPGFLSIVWYKILPAQYGGQKGIAGFNHYLGEKVQLSCLCSADNEATGQLTYSLLPQLPVSKTQFINPAVRKLIVNEIAQNHYSHIILEHPYHAWLSKYKTALNFKLIVHAHNIEFIRMRQRKKWWWPWVKSAERKAFGRADYILFKTQKDKEQSQQIFGTTEDKCLIVPYGVNKHTLPANTEKIKEKIKLQYRISGDEKILLFAGTPDYEPNAAALNNIIHKILPLLSKKSDFPFRIFICGKQEHGLINTHINNKHLVFTGFVDSIDEYMQAADLFINPVTAGSGIQTKNMEALANNLSLACTTFAAEGLPAYLLNSKVLTAENNNWEEFTDNIVTLLHNPAVTPPAFYNDFYWGNIIDRTLTKFV